jgi:putative transposase
VTAAYELIDAEKANHTIVDMCTWLGVSRSGYYEWRHRPASATAERRERLKAMIATIFHANHETYGYRRVHAALERRGERVSPELVRQLMRELGLRACQPGPWRPLTTDADPHHFADRHTYTGPRISRAVCAISAIPTDKAPDGPCDVKQSMSPGTR